MIYITSDTHFGHANIIKYSNRPFRNVKDMDDTLINNINSIVKEDDVLWHLGDFCLAGKSNAMSHIEYYRNRIKCRRIHLIMGNHDPYYHGSPDKQLLNYFESVNSLISTNIFNTSVVFCHYALRVWNKAHHGAIHLYGHSHNMLPEENNLSFDIGVDAIAARFAVNMSPKIVDAPVSFKVLNPQDYRPLSFDEVLAIMNTKSIGNQAIKQN